VGGGGGGGQDPQINFNEQMYRSFVVDLIAMIVAKVHTGCVQNCTFYLNRLTESDFDQSISLAMYR
jgi:hypothetical protein